MYQDSTGAAGFANYQQPQPQAEKFGANPFASDIKPAASGWAAPVQ